jgi:fructan beta-fructosidase
VEGERGVEKWALIVNVGSGAPAGGSGCQYFVGDFDGRQFTPDAPAAATDRALWADWARDFYAAVSWSDVPKRDGRRLWLGWMSNWEYANDVPTSPWRSAMSIARSLSLRKAGDTWHLLQQPVKEMDALRGRRGGLVLKDLAGHAELSKLKGLATDLFEFEAELKPGTNAVFDVTLHTGATEETVLRFDVPGGKLTLDRTRSGHVGFHKKFPGIATAPLRLINGRLRLRLFADTSSIEAFINDGETVLTSLILPSGGERRLELRVTRGELHRAKLSAWPLASAWRADR